ncbi:methionine-tRNA ligase, variant 1 [Aphanomyces astaci]|uniref:methionine--tRNA ligase n=1 Tax=Aphanomyces astaci TaxID=112090 RepID=W4H5R7_APHAT|nr:methionine-tRNA ligase [Aphanomyces astaci]XP_009823736.1 methionine-tRNA ligase, variant 1 [Aphanomyces astaci]ETV86935.1 methionine-tRNA ligase [Aphanomyces astaci]ETV86936.1 methionine-tRNA ligase, variant 1 [Aphanomyces astaci]|eukprot:XP_009823734.1 methionine-tRNA ligase [Aphanomyces astaci]
MLLRRLALLPRSGAAVRPQRNHPIVRFTATTTTITTPIFYVNASPHLGHLHSSLMADALSRWFQFRNEPTLFTTGTDEHGLKVQQAADKAGKPTGQFCDDVAATFQAMCASGDIRYDRFVRTTEPSHAVAVASMWRTLVENDYIYLGEHEAYYCISDETFLTEMQVDTRDDGQIVSKESGHPVELVKEQNYKFRLSKLQDKLLAWLDDHPDVVQPPSRYNEVRATVERGLRDVSVSRLREKIAWAIPVPDDDNHSVYVWLDALTNYLTCCKYPTDMAHFQSCWPAAYHIVGKDILKFHAIYWPAFLLAAKLPLPRKIVAHAHWTVNGVKMSKSLGNVVTPDAIIEKFGLDAVRYYLLREGVLTDDGDFNEGMLKEHVNNELADTLGNLVIRCTTLAFLPQGNVPSGGDFSPDDLELIHRINDTVQQVQCHYERPDFALVTKTIMGLLYEVNRNFSKHEPWVVAKQLKTLAIDSEEAKVKRQLVDTTLLLSIEAVRVSALLLLPVVPSMSTGILNYLNVPTAERSFEFCRFGQSTFGPVANQKSNVKFVPFRKLE